MRRLHLAIHVPLRKRCDERFVAMPAVPGGRFCGSCEKVVHDLSAMTVGAASRFVAGRAGEPTCYRYLARPDGTLVFAREPARPQLTALVAISLAACTPWGPPQQPASETPDVMPGMFADPPIVIPAATPDEHEPDNEYMPDAPAADPPAIEPTNAASSDVRYPRTPVARPVHVPRPRVPEREQVVEFLGGEG